MKTSLVLVVTLLIAASGFIAVREHAEREAVREAVLDYVEGIYDVQPERIARSVHPSLAKVGYWREEGSTEYGEGRMTYEQLYELAGSWNKSGRLPVDAPKEIEVYDVLDQTAIAKLSAQWGIDYLHLAKIDGKWMIMNVLWQSYPPEGK